MCHTRETRKKTIQNTSRFDGIHGNLVNNITYGWVQETDKYKPPSDEKTILWKPAEDDVKQTVTESSQFRGKSVGVQVSKEMITV